MAKSGIGDLVGWGIAGVGVWWVGSMFGWWNDLFGGALAATTTTATPTTTTAAPTTTATTTPPVSTAPPATTPTPPGKIPLKPPVIAPKVVLSGPVSAGVHSGSLKASISINGTAQVLSCSPSLGCYNSAGHGFTLPSGVTVAQIYALMQAAAPKGLSGYGMSAGIIPSGVPMRVPGARVMVHARRKNYVMRGSGY